VFVWPLPHPNVPPRAPYPKCILNVIFFRCPKGIYYYRDEEIRDGGTKRSFGRANEAFIFLTIPSGTAGGWSPVIDYAARSLLTAPLACGAASGSRRRTRYTWCCTQWPGRPSRSQISLTFPAGNIFFDSFVEFGKKRAYFIIGLEV